MQGLHLYHYDLSNASQKVRIVLDVKGIAYTSHHVDLAKNEHLTPEYLKVNPQGVVPTLVHDGVVVVESSDIMAYLDEHFPDPPLQPASEAGRLEMRAWVARHDSMQRSVRILSHEFLLKRLGHAGDPEPGGHAAFLSPKEVAALRREIGARTDYAASTIAGAVRVVEDALAEANRHLAGRTWFVGEAFGLADVAWMVDVHRLTLMHFPLRAYPDLRRWWRRARALPSFSRAVLAHEPAGVRRLFRLHTWRRRLSRSHAGAARWRDPRLFANA